MKTTIKHRVFIIAMVITAMSVLGFIAFSSITCSRKHSEHYACQELVDSINVIAFDSINKVQVKAVEDLDSCYRDSIELHYTFSDEESLKPCIEEGPNISISNDWFKGWTDEDFKELEINFRVGELHMIREIAQLYVDDIYNYKGMLCRTSSRDSIKAYSDSIIIYNNHIDYLDSLYRGISKGLDTLINKN